MVGKEKPFFWRTCCREFVSLDLLRSHVVPESPVHMEGSKAEGESLVFSSRK